MLLFATDFLAMMNTQRIVSITGFKGSGKDLLVHELVQPYLRDDYTFYENAISVWNDPLYIPVEKARELLRFPVNKYDTTRSLVEYAGYSKGENPFSSGFVPDIRRRVLSITEGGAYLRRWDYFENIGMYARKLKLYIFIPSLRLAHDDLADFVVYPIFPFTTYLGINGGVWGYKLQTGFGRGHTGWFVHLPKKDYGIYDTEDLSENTNAILGAISHEIDADQRRRGRDGLQGLGALAQGIDMESQSKIAARIAQNLVSVSRRK